MNSYLAKFYSNHVLANLLFILVLMMGFFAYQSLPREQDPSISFNWIHITTLYPGAAAEDVEKLITDPLEEAIRKISDIRFVSSNSRESVSEILVRFNDLKQQTFEKRLNDLRREIQSKENDLPVEAHQPVIYDVNSANAFPTATLVVVGQANDEKLRLRAKAIREDLERFFGVERVNAFGLHDPELQILFDPRALAEHGLNPVDLANTVSAHFRDVSAGAVDVGTQKWLVRWLGREASPEYVAKIPILQSRQELVLGEIAKVQRGRQKPARLVNYQGKHAVMLSVMKQADTNTLDLVANIKEYVEEQQGKLERTGVELHLLDDQTEITQNALDVMQNNAILGLLLVLFTTWLFLGLRISLLVSIGIPFTLAGTFWMLKGLGQTLNVSVLLGVVITLGMLVDDSVVVVEAIYYRLSRGMNKMQAIVEAIREVFAPVTTSVLTTAAAFVPLMLLPGILGKFMMVIPMVVTLALLISLVEAYWMLPSHIDGMPIKFSKNSRIQQTRINVTRWLRINYIRLLIKFIRRPVIAFVGLLLLFLTAVGCIASGLIHVNFFASDPLRIFYVNVEMPPGTGLQNTMDQMRAIEGKVAQHLQENETRSIISYAGIMFSEIEPLLGDQYGQVMVSLKPQKGKLRHVDDVIETMREQILATSGPLNISFLRLAGGPPTSKPINVKVRGTDFLEIREAVKTLETILGSHQDIFDISNDDNLGRGELDLRPNLDAIHRAGLDPMMISRIVRLLIDGEIITSFQNEGEKVDVRLRAEAGRTQLPYIDDLNGLRLTDSTQFMQGGATDRYTGIKDVLNRTIALPNGVIRLSELVHAETKPSLSNIRHYNFRRAITVTADIDKEKLDTVSANEFVRTKWENFSRDYPRVDLNFTGELDDIQESINAIPYLFLFGIGLIYLILGTQFKSYWQPLMILATVPLAFTGVTFGLLLSNNPLSLFTLYGIVALSGITVNASIVLISAANQRLEQGMSVVYATLYAARRRLIPIIITSMTTIAGLLSLALGLGGSSLLWGPVATSIVWGLMFSTVLTLFFVPPLYRLFMNRGKKRKRQAVDTDNNRITTEHALSKSHS